MLGLQTDNNIESKKCISVRGGAAAGCSDKAKNCKIVQQKVEPG